MPPENSTRFTNTAPAAIDPYSQAVRAGHAFYTCVLAALGFNTIFMLWFIKPAIGPEQRGFYHWSGPASNFFLPIALNFLATWFALILLLWASRSPGRARVIVWSGLCFMIPWSILKSLEALSLIRPNHLGRVLFLGALVATILLTALWRPTFARRFESFVASATTVLIFIGIFGGLMLCRLAWYGWQASSLQGQFPLHHAQTASTAKPNRMIWIVMDELSYQQTYEHRFPGLELPAFDALAKGATSFTNAIPPDIQTEVVLPGLFAGKPFDNIRTSLTGLSAHDPNTGKWQPFNQHDTVFQDALDAGYSTAIAGWYNPYCRIVSEVADQCFWTYRAGYLGIVPSGTVLSNTLQPLQALIARIPTFGAYRQQKYLQHLLHGANKETSTYLHIEDYQALDAASNRLLRDPSAGFVFLHLPVPHPLGIYDRHTGKFTQTNSSYINNLALADKCLAGIRQTLEQIGQWDSSTIVLMGDHSWRTRQIWRFPKIQHGWTREDEAASHGGQYDPRPAYLVKLPNQTTPASIDAPYRTVNTRKLFDQLLAHKITTPAQLSTWAQGVH